MTQLSIYNLALSKLGEPAVPAVDSSLPAAVAVTLVYQNCIDRLLRKYRWNFSRAMKVIEPVFVTPTSVSDYVSGSDTLINVEKTSHGLSTGDRVLIDGSETSDGYYIITRIDADNFTLDESVWNPSMNVDDTTYHVAPKHTWGYVIAWPSDAIAIRTVDNYEADKPTSRFTIQNGTILCNSDSVDVVYSKALTAGSGESTFDPVFTNLLACHIAMEVAVAVTGAMARRREMEALYAQELQDALMSNVVERRDPVPPRKGTSPVDSVRIYGE